MTEPPGRAETLAADPPSAELPEGEAFKRGSLSVVWLIPVIALVVGGWLAYKTWSEKGPTVTIAFKAAAGLQVGKTVVKFKDVEVGKVTTILVSQDLKSVLVTVELVAGTEPWLTNKTRFWIARPRVAAGRVSGLDTLLSGAFIEMDPVTEGKSARTFVGLEEPPLFKTDEPGKRFTLRSDSGGVLNAGSPVYYRGQQVGQVISSRLDEDAMAQNIEVFIASPQDRLVKANTRFWNASGLDFTLGSEGIRFDSESFVTMLLGGVTFDTPVSIDQKSDEAPAGYIFRLYASRDAAHARVYENKQRYLMFFNGSVRGLSIGAPVLLRGIEIGKVLDVQLDFDIADFTFEIPVLIEVEPERVNIKGDTDGVDYDQSIERLVVAGLRGQLQTGSLLTGQLFVELGFHPEAPAATVVVEDGYTVVPTVPAPLEAVASKVNGLLDTLGRLPLEEIANDLRDTIKSVNLLVSSRQVLGSVTELSRLLIQANATLAKLDKQMVPEAVATLRQARTALSSAQELVGNDSAMVEEIMLLLRELSATSRAIKGMADYLERHPEALIRGKARR